MPTSKTDYTALDAAILTAIETKKSPLWSRDVVRQAEIAVAGTIRPPFRAIDGRLQALRKAGKIVADRKAFGGWRLA